ncbi:thioesterase II family protein [Nannocystaceae bacterium ST9]
MTQGDPWLIPMGRGDASLRLFCLPHAGSGAVQFRFWANVLGPAIDVVAIQPPGRENRASESPLTSLESMLAEIVPRIAEAITGPYAFFGHSMGARMAYEVARELIRLGHPAPRKLLLSGHGPPGSDRSGRLALSKLSDADLLAHLRRTGETPRELLDDHDFSRRLISLLKTDAGVTEGVPPREGPSLACPLRVFGGADDPMWTPDDLLGWSALTSADCRFRVFPGGHLYLVSSSQLRMQVLEVVRAELMA